MAETSTAPDKKDKKIKDDSSLHEDNDDTTKLLKTPRNVQMKDGSSFYIPDGFVAAESARKTCLLAFPSKFSGNRIYVLYGSTQVQSILRQGIQKYWSKGIAGEQDFDIKNNFGAFKLRGKAIGKAVKLISGIVEEMIQGGWGLKSTINFYRYSKSDSFLFQRSKGAPKALEGSKICALKLQSSNKMHLVGSPESLFSRILQIIKDNWPAGLRRNKDLNNGEYRIVMKGSPWRSVQINENFGKSRMVVLQVVRAIHGEGYALLSSGHPNQVTSEVDTLFFAQGLNPPPMDGSFIFGIPNHNHLIIVDAPESCVETVREGISTKWKGGILKEECIDVMWSFKLKGSPWRTSGETSTLAHLLLIHIFETLRSGGWRVYATIDMNRNVNDASHFVMVKGPPVQRDVMALKLSGVDFFRLINAPSDAVQCVRETLTGIWPKQVNETTTKICTEFRFSKCLSECQGVFCVVFDRLEALGWQIISSADLSVKYYADAISTFPDDLHTIFFEKLSTK